MLCSHGYLALNNVLKVYTLLLCKSSISQSLLVGRLGHWGPAGHTKETIVSLVEYERERWDG